MRRTIVRLQDLSRDQRGIFSELEGEECIFTIGFIFYVVGGQSLAAV